MNKLSKTIIYKDLKDEIDRLLNAYDLVVVEISTRKVSGRVYVDIFLAKIQFDAAASPDTSDLEKASSILHIFFDNYFKDEDYFLTLSSPGIDRSLKFTYEFDIFKGRIVKLSYLGDEDESITIVGRILSVGDDFVELLSNGNKKTILIDSIKSAVLQG